MNFEKHFGLVAEEPRLSGIARSRVWYRALLAVAVIAMVAAAVSSPPAAQAGNLTFSGTGVIASNSVYNVNYYVVPASGNPSGEGVPRVQYINVTGDKAATVVQFYKVKVVAPVTASASVAATNVLSATFASAQAYSNAVAVLWNKVGTPSPDLYQRLTITNNSTTTISFRENTANATLAGDTIFILVADATLPVGVNTKEFNAVEGLYGGVQTYPILIEANGGTNSPLNCVSGWFQRLPSQ